MNDSRKSRMDRGVSYKRLRHVGPPHEWNELLDIPVGGLATFGPFIVCRYYDLDGMPLWEVWSAFSFMPLLETSRLHIIARWLNNRFSKAHCIDPTTNQQYKK